MLERLSNPTAPVASVSTFLDFREYGGDLPGADNQRSTTLVLQPTFPFPLENGNAILFRPALPILLRQPVSGSEGGEFTDETELADLGFDLAYGGTDPDTGFLFLGGIIGNIPLATSTDVGLDQ